MLLSLLAGTAIGYPSTTLLLGTLGYLLWIFNQIRLVDDWLIKPDRNDKPELWGIHADIIDRVLRLQRQNELESQVLRASLDRQRTLISDVRDGVVLLDSRSRIKWFNKAAEGLIRLNTERDIGVPIRGAIRNASFHAWFESGEFSESRRICFDESRKIWLDISITEYDNSERLLVLRDASMLQELEDMRRDFIANLSHELRTPVTVLVGYLETLEMRLANDPQALGITREMDQQCQRISALLRDLLTLAKLESMDGRNQQQSINLSPILERIVADAPKLAEFNNHQISTDIEPDLAVMSTETDLQSAFSNLVYNAVRHTGANTAIHVSARSRRDQVIVEVSDEGPGIPRQHLHRLTERFYRVESSRNSDTGGTGLGLAIAKHALLRSQATLDIESTPGQGSTFRCAFETSAQKPLEQTNKDTE